MLTLFPKLDVKDYKKHMYEVRIKVESFQEKFYICRLYEKLKKINKCITLPFLKIGRFNPPAFLFNTQKCIHTFRLVYYKYGQETIKIDDQLIDIHPNTIRIIDLLTLPKSHYNKIIYETETIHKVKYLWKRKTKLDC